MQRFDSVITFLQDYYNLVDVYLDAVLHPNCVRDEKTFAQEGWHFELEKPEVGKDRNVAILGSSVKACAHVDCETFCISLKAGSM